MAEVNVTIQASDGSAQVFRAVAENSKSAASGVDSLGSACATAKTQALAFFEGMMGVKAVEYAVSKISELRSKITELMTESTLLAARTETMEVVMHTAGKTAGMSATATDNYAESVKAMGITTLQSKDAVVKMIQAHMDMSKATQLARVAQDAAVVANINSSEAMQRLIYGIQSGQVEVLRTMGINVNFEASYASLAKQLNKTALDLTEQEKTQARTNVVMEAGKAIAGSYEEAMGTVGKQLTSMARPLEDLKAKFGQILTPALSVIVVQLTNDLKDMIKELDQAARDGRMKEWAEGIASGVKSAISGIKTLGENFDKLIILLGSAAFLQAPATISAISAAFNGITAANTLGTMFPTLIAGFNALKGMSFAGLISGIGSVGSWLGKIPSVLGNIGSMSVSALGPVGLAGFATAAGLAGYELGKALDKAVYKLTGWDMSGMNTVNKLMKDNAEQQEYLNSRADKYNAKLRELGFEGPLAMKLFKEAVKAGSVVFDEATGKWVKSIDLIKKAQEESKKAIEESIKALKEMSSVISDIGKEQLKFSGEQFATGIKENIKNIDEMKVSMQSYLESVRDEKYSKWIGDNIANINTMRTSLQGYLGTIDAVYAKQMEMQKKLADAAKGVGDPKAIAAAQMEAFKIEAGLANSRLAAWQQYYSILQTAHNTAMENMKAKTKELADLEVKRAEQWNTYADLQNGLRQKLMTEEQKYYDKLGILAQQYQVAMSLEGEAKIKALNEWMAKRAAVSDAVVEGDRVIIDKETAVRNAMSDIATAQGEVGRAFDQVKGKRQAEIEQIGAWKTQLETAMSKAKEMMGLYQEQIVNLDNQLAKQRILMIDTSKATQDIRNVVQELNAIPPVTYKVVVVEYRTKASPEMPFTEGMTKIRQMMTSLPTGSEYTVRFGSLADEWAKQTATAEQLGSMMQFGGPGLSIAGMRQQREAQGQSNQLWAEMSRIYTANVQQQAAGGTTVNFNGGITVNAGGPDGAGVGKDFQQQVATDIENGRSPILPALQKKIGNH
ncbi:MAG: hypothetical protein M0024_01280 [Nitrospiraceae bacterium]|nr:hypothetical protein [Nitrospiraceae bacterium]